MKKKHEKPFEKFKNVNKKVLKGFLKAKKLVIFFDTEEIKEVTKGIAEYIFFNKKVIKENNFRKDFVSIYFLKYLFGFNLFRKIIMQIISKHKNFGENRKNIEKYLNLFDKFEKFEIFLIKEFELYEFLQDFNVYYLHKFTDLCLKIFQNTSLKIINYKENEDIYLQRKDSKLELNLNFKEFTNETFLILKKDFHSIFPEKNNSFVFNFIPKSKNLSKNKHENLKLKEYNAVNIFSFILEGLKNDKNINLMKNLNLKEENKQKMIKFFLSKIIKKEKSRKLTFLKIYDLLISSFKPKVNEFLFITVKLILKRRRIEKLPCIILLSHLIQNYFDNLNSCNLIDKIFLKIFKIKWDNFELKNWYRKVCGEIIKRGWFFDSLYFNFYSKNLQTFHIGKVFKVIKKTEDEEIFLKSCSFEKLFIFIFLLEHHLKNENIFLFEEQKRVFIKICFEKLKIEKFKSKNYNYFHLNKKIQRLEKYLAN